MRDLAQICLDKFQARVSELLELDLPVHEGTRAELNPRSLKLSEEARNLLEGFYNRVERASGTGGVFEYITGFAAKAPEMATRPIFLYMASNIAYIRNKSSTYYLVRYLLKGM